MDERKSADNGRLDALERRLDMMEDRQSAIERSRAVVNAMVPSETRRHLRAAWRENLLAARSLLDSWIDTLSDEREVKSDNGRETIRID